MRAALYTDGASSGNPGPSGIGFVIKYSDKTCEGSEHIGTATNNVAEYSALILGLKKALSMGISEIDAYLDSELIVKQMRGEYKVKNRNLMPLFLEVQGLSRSFKSISFSHIPRELNKSADKLAKGATEATGLSD